MTEYLTKKELAQIAGYTYRRIYDIDKSLPESEKLFVQQENGDKYSLPLFVQRWVKYNAEKLDDGDFTLEEAKTVHEKIKTRKTELQVAIMEGLLVDVNTIRRLWGDVAHNAMSNLLKVPDKISGMLIMVNDQKMIEGIITQAIRDALDELAETPIPQADDKDEEESEE